MESVCDDSSEDDETHVKPSTSSRQLPPRFMSLGSSEVSSDGSSLSPASSRQSSLQVLEEKLLKSNLTFATLSFF